MSNIQGVYTLRAPLYNSGDVADRVLYTFTNNDRHAYAGFGKACTLDFAQTDAQNPDNNGDPRKFIINNKLFVKRGRIITPGAPGLAPELGGRAAKLVLSSYSHKNGSETHGDSLVLKFDHFNEWQDFGFCFENYDIQSDTGVYQFGITTGSSSSLFFDDYNLQSAYEGQDLYAFLELFVDTAGLKNGFNSVV